MFSQRFSALHRTMAVFSFLLLAILSGCADREELEKERRQQAPGYNKEANEALEKAEKAMAQADIEINFKKLSGLDSLTDLRSILPDPVQIRQLEKQQKMEEAIESLYVALDALGESGVSRAPARSVEASDSDLALIHLHLFYCYALSAVSRLARLGAGPDEVPGTTDDLYYISFSADPKAKEIYRFKLTDRAKKLIDAVNPKVDPYGYIKVFYNEGQVEALQAIIDSLLLVLDAEVGVIENPAEGIRAHKPTVDKLIYRKDALYHLDRALEIARLIAPGLTDALNELDETIMEHFTKEILEKAIEWGLDIGSIPPRYENLLKR